MFMRCSGGRLAEGLRVADPGLWTAPEPITAPMFRLGEIHRLGREAPARYQQTAA